jgi:hapalindole H/12-epi-hapalindole U/12-epi-fischerindole U synthase
MLAFLQRYLPTVALMLAFSGGFAATSFAAPLTVINSGFEDTSGQTVFNEFTFGTPTGWQIHDPNNIVPDPDVFTGTLLPDGVQFFNSTAPEGNRVAILFNQGQRDAGEYGYVQVLADTVQANTRYTLSVEVGNIATGTSPGSGFFNLDGFPGYRVELLAVTLNGGGDIVGTTALEQDLDTLVIPEGEFLTSTLTVDIGALNANLGERLAIRLVNLNETRGEPGPPDLEVDFDDVRLDAETIVLSEPGTAMLFGLGLIGMALRRRRA